jgi:hypothetical protein
MDVQSWATLNRLLEEALDVVPSEREAWLGSLTADYDAFKPRLRAMLQQLTLLDRSNLFATLPRFDIGDEAEMGAGAEIGPGAIVGQYRVVRRLAAGGQG